MTASTRTKRQIRQRRPTPNALMEHDIAVIECLIQQDVDPLDLQRNANLKAVVALPNGRLLTVPAKWLRRRLAPPKAKDCPHCGSKLGMVYDYFWQFWRCVDCNWRLPANTK